MSLAELESATLLAEPHHDGSDLYVLERPDDLGGDAVVRVRAPGDFDAVALRYTDDGEARAVEAQSDGDGWWVARFPGRNPTVRYRWLFYGRGPETRYEWFGGDLGGVEERLDHIESLGANVIYLTPLFPAGSTHRYDSTTFDRIDPLLGGDEALESLVRAAHARGLRVISDLTTNHTGDGHEWLLAGERDLYLFDESGDYEARWGSKALPKLNWLSEDLLTRMQGVPRTWLQP